MLVDFEDDIVDELSEKSNKLYIHRRFIRSMLSPESYLGENYTIVSGLFYNELIRHYPANHHVPCFAFKDYKPSVGE